jgi:hypothetical protein
MGADVPRGPWPYDGEIDLGFGGALRMAATIVTRDPIFDWIAYGGVLTLTNDSLSVVPRDGLRQRFCAVVGGPKNLMANIQRLRIELDRDGFAAERTITLDKSLEKISFTVENRTGDRHTTGLWLSLPEGGSYTLKLNGNQVPLQPTRSWDYPLRAELEVGTNSSILQLTRTAPRQ